MDRLEINLSLLSLLTFCLWYNQTANHIVGIIVYLFIFIILFLKKQPFCFFLLVSLYSIMSIGEVKDIKIESVLIIILFIYSISKVKQKNIIVIGNLLFILTIQLIYSFLSISYTYVKLDGFIGCTALIQGYLIYFILTNSQVTVDKNSFIKISKIASYFLITLSCEIFTIYFRYGWQSVLNNKELLYLGWGFSNTIAVVYVLLLPLAFYKYTKPLKPTYFIIDIINVFGLILTLSRGAYIGFVSAIGLLIVYHIGKRKLIRFTSILAVFLTIMFSFKTMRTEIFSIIRYFFDDSKRFLLYRVAYDSFLDKPIFGNGIKSSKYLIRTYTTETNANFHNFILQTMATLGIIGLILLVIYFSKLIQVLKYRQEKFIFLISLGIVGELVHQLFDISFNRYFFGILFYTLIALVEIYRDQQKLDSYQMKRYIINKDRK